MFPLFPCCVRSPCVGYRTLDNRHCTQCLPLNCLSSRTAFVVLNSPLPCVTPDIPSILSFVAPNSPRASIVFCFSTRCPLRPILWRLSLPLVTLRCTAPTSPAPPALPDQPDFRSSAAPEPALLQIPDVAHVSSLTLLRPFSFLLLSPSFPLPSLCPPVLVNTFCLL